MNDDNILGGALNQLGQTVKQTVKQVIKIPEEMVADVGGQIGGAPLRSGSEGQAKPVVSGEPKQNSDWKSDEERVKFLKDLYGSSDQNPAANQNPTEEKSKAKQTSANPLTTVVEKKTPSEFQEQIKDKSPEEQKKLMELRQQLHKDYYDALVNLPKPKEERPAEKVEQEKKQEMQDLQQKDAEKPPPLAVIREQNKAEVFRGASG